MSEILIGVFSTALAAVITNPVEVLRTKLINVEEETKYTYTNTNRQNLRQLLKETGMKGLESGLPISLTYYSVTNGIRLGFFSTMEARGFLNKKENGQFSFAKSVAVATGGALIGGFLANPLFVLKHQLQLTAGEENPKKPVLETIKQIYEKRGLKGFYRGYFQAVPIITSGSVAQLVSFAFVQDWMLKRGSEEQSLYLSSIPALASSLSVVLFTNPIDNCLTQMHYQRGRGYLDSFRTILKVDGFRGFYRGSFLSLLRVVPHNFITLIIWDRLRRKYQQTP